ncbi:YheC/YheD family protein [Schinkia azotoformans]|uniref:YheC/YheD family endospore coat-associated protein n=1 Tax=Schinkia azotoformans TaxID=1454 RepID=UPI002E1C87D8|nr:YheC/YheD family protein [Schinkia azotoformans]
MKINKNFRKQPFIVGILTTAGKNSKITGNLSLFRDISTRLAKRGGKAVLFTPDSLKENRLTSGFVFIKRKNCWVTIDFDGVPTVIYNRIPYRKDENTDQFKLFKAWCNDHNVPMFNGGFFKKWDVYNALTNDSTLKKHIPFTQLIRSKEQLEEQLNKFHSLYLKPNEGSKGNGIFVLSRHEDETFHIKGHSGMYGTSFFQNIWEKKVNPLLFDREYILQQKTDILTYEECPFDYRVLAHHVKNKWVVSGIGIRQSKLNGITTHVLKGGNILIVDEITTEKDIRKIQNLAILCGNTMEQAFRDSSKFGLIKEFSMDVGKTVEGAFYIFDVNSKPMKFDEPDIYEAGLNHLVDIFLEYE